MTSLQRSLSHPRSSLHRIRANEFFNTLPEWAALFLYPKCISQMGKDALARRAAPFTLGLFPDREAAMNQSLRLHHIVHWRLAVVAGICAGAVFILACALYLATITQLGVWTVFRYLASIVLGQGVLTPHAGFDAGVVLVALGITFLLSIIYAFILAFIIHRWGLLVGVIGGALYGIALYFINLYTLTLFFPWFFALNGIPLLVSFILFGMVAGGVYELLDDDDEPFFPRRVQGETQS